MVQPLLLVQLWLLPWMVQKKIFTILGNTEGDFKNNVIAGDAPLAQAMLGKHVGDTFSFNSRTIVIKKIEKI